MRTSTQHSDCRFAVCFVHGCSLVQTLQEGEASYGAIMADGPDAAAGAAQAATSTAAAPPAPAALQGLHATPGHAACAGAVAALAPHAAAAVGCSSLHGGAAAQLHLPQQNLQLQQQQHQPVGAPGFASNFLGNFNVDDEDDEEFRLDPLEWLLDNEADAAEEEALLRHVEQSVGALSDLATTQDDAAANTTAAAATSRRRTQREAARRAAERIAAKQQQWILGQQQLMQQGQILGPAPDGGGMGGVLLQQQQPALQPLIPAAAAGDMQQQAEGSGQLAAAAWGAPDAWQPPFVPGTAHGLQGFDSMQQQQHHLPQDAAAGLQGAWDAGGRQAQQHQQQEDSAHASVLTIRAGQLQQLYQQVSLHTQMLTQLYAVTARDASPEARVMASAAGQMLEQVRRMHASSTVSVRGQQLGQLVQHAFAEAAGSTTGHGAGVAQEPASMHKGSQGLVWKPPVSNMQTIWDTYALRQLDHVVHRVQVGAGPSSTAWQLSCIVFLNLLPFRMKRHF